MKINLNNYALNVYNFHFNIVLTNEYRNINDTIYSGRRYNVKNIKLNDITERIKTEEKESIEMLYE